MLLSKEDVEDLKKETLKFYASRFVKTQNEAEIATAKAHLKNIAIIINYLPLLPIIATLLLGYMAMMDKYSILWSILALLAFFASLLVTEINSIAIDELIRYAEHGYIHPGFKKS